ncbi:unnamed protein product [Phytophthora fragariaefolia]|uniref:Unnamed protein product n=1 Tax=Phytophthora fragariaefolia TaxID=1490495 RepID=A0A9W6XLA3_9STRA|nr:unnamed protein product [Phytophthora fragariaefolia]
MDLRWSNLCPLCGIEEDTQDHRFGLSDSIHPCDGLDQLSISLRRVHHALEKPLWKPDQALFIPLLGHEIAAMSGLPTRPRWSDGSTSSAIWSVMVQLCGELWVHATLLDWLGLPTRESQHDALVHALRNEISRPKLAPAGRIFLHYLCAAIQTIHSQVGLYDAQLSQWTTGWAGASFEGIPDATVLTGLQHLLNPEQVRVWWIDDMYVPRTEDWLEAFRDKYERQSHPTGLRRTYWIGTYETIPGHATAESLSVTWVVQIPAGKLKMRTDLSVVQHQQRPQLKSIFARTENLSG